MPEDSSVERLKRRLYARGEGPKLHERRALHDQAHEVSQNWLGQEDVQRAQDLEYEPERLLKELREGHVPGHEAEQGPAILYDERARAGTMVQSQKRRVMSRLIRGIFIASLVFFLGAGGYAFYVFYTGNGTVSCDRLDINIAGPVSVPSGKELLLNIGLMNRNPVAMEDTSLVVEYPEGTRSAENPAMSMPTARQQIGTIDANTPVRTTARAILYGKEQSEQDINTRVEFHVAGSNAPITCTAPYHVVIATAPVSLTVDGLEEVSSGQEVDLTVKVTSNSEETVPDLRLVADYPFGYTFIDATPKPTNNLNVWDIGDLAPGTSRTITVRGTVAAQSIEARSIKFSVGQKDPSKPAKLATTLQAIDHALLITRPFLDLTMALNRDTADEIAITPGTGITGELHWKNILPYPIYDAQFEIVIASPFVDLYSVHASNGYFRSSDQTMIWTSQTDSALKAIDPGAEGTLGFGFSTKPLQSGTSASDPSMSLDVTVKANRIETTTNVEQKLLAQSKRTIKFISNLAFTPHVYYGTGPFTNTGPYPPRADQETTYTIVWDLTNSTNDVTNAQVSAELPIYVTWLNHTSPSSENISYNPTTHQLTWSVGDVPASTGFQLPKREVAFQVSMVPSIQLIREVPPLVTKQLVRAVDRFTGSVLEQNPRDLTTELIGDPFFPNPQGAVLP